MAQIFKIATSSKLDRFNVIGEKSKVKEELFWQMVEIKVKEITADSPEEFDKAIETVKTYFQKDSVTILDTYFEINSSK